MMANLPITRKLIVAFTAIMVVTLVSAGFSIHQTRLMQHHVVHNSQSGALLDRVVVFRERVEEAQGAVLDLIYQGDVGARDRVRTEFARAAEEGRGFRQAVAADPPLSRLADEALNLLATWRQDIVEPQLADVRDPYSMDMARVRQGSLENGAITERLEETFHQAVGIMRERQDAARVAQSREVSLLMVAAITSCVVLLLMCIAMAVLARASVARPIRALADVTARLKDRDWSVTIPGAGRGDEVGDLARALEVFRENGVRAEELEAQRERDSAMKMRQAELVRDAVNMFRDNSGGLIEQLGKAGVSLSGEAASLRSVAGDSFDYTQSVSQAAEATEASVQNVAAAIEEMSMSIRDISGQLQNVARLTDRTREASSQAGQKVTGLKERSDKIHEVIDLINGIAGQINLLALNATIESARAGEAGKGFAVVAQQVKQLADQTARATGDIDRVITQVSTDVNEVVQAIRTIDASVEEVNSNAAAVSNAVDEQSTALDEISRNVAVVTTQTGHVAGNVRSVESKVGETRKVAGHVSELSDTLKSSSTDLGASIDAFIATVARDAGRQPHHA